MDHVAPSIAPPPNTCFLLQAKFGRAGGLAKLQGPIVYAAPQHDPEDVGVEQVGNAAPAAKWHANADADHFP